MSMADLRETSRVLREAALTAADPRGAVARALSPAQSGLVVCGRIHPVQGRLLLLAVGKASGGMAEATLEIFGARVSQGLVVMPHGYGSFAPRDARLRVLASGHPVPDAASIDAAQEAVRLVDGMTEGDVLLLLLSGGGSSLLSLPHPPLSLSDLVETGRLLLASGADIHELNTVRRHTSGIAGGRLAERCRGSILTLAVSDVVGDELHAIASGPGVADPTTFADAAMVLDRHGLLDRVPRSVRALIQEGAAGALPETPKLLASRHQAAVIASGLATAEAAADAARGRGFMTRILTTRLSGEAREAGRMLARAGLDARGIGRHAPGVGQGPRPSPHALPLPACLIAAGETTVTLRGHGKGGRNQEIALAAAMELAGVPGILLTSFATDGIEGNTDAAGATASGETIAAGKAAGLDPAACLAANDSHAFLRAAGELIVTGPTGTNVNDITFVLVEGED